MKIAVLSEATKLTFARSEFANEVGGKISLAYEFSDPDGERSGKSGWSFGIVQYDINNNPNAILALREMNFTTDEIRALKEQTIDDMSAMNAKLAANKDIIDQWDRKQIAECLSWPLILCNEASADFSSEETFIHIADYHNQFGMSRGGKMHSWIRGLFGTTIYPEMIRNFKYSTDYGKKQLAKNDPEKDDVKRRYDNIVRIARNSA
jgi:hypothetical protein